jgi:hypothetical protein
MKRGKSIFSSIVLTATIPLLLGNFSENSVGFDRSDERSIRIEIVTELNFSRAAVIGAGGGEIAVAADQGSKTSAQGMVDLGGYAMAGQVRVYGEPGRAVRIDLPRVVKMQSTSGGHIEISDLRSNLPPAPRLDAQGELSFAFGGRLAVTGNASGSFRGRIPITVDYQ